MSTNAAAKRIDDTVSPSAALSPIMRADQEARKQYNDLMARRMGMRPRGRYNNLNSRTPVAAPKLAIPSSIVMPANMFKVDKEHNPTQPHQGNYSSMKSPAMVQLDGAELKSLGAQTSFRDPISKKDIPYSAPGPQMLTVGPNAAATLIPNPKDMAKLTSKTSSTPTQTGQQPHVAQRSRGTVLQGRHQASTSPRMSMGGLVKRARQ